MSVLTILILVHIESVGIYSPEKLFIKAINIIKEKCESWSGILDEVLNTNNNTTMK